MSTSSRKRPAADQEPRVDGGKKRPRYAFGSIYDYEKLESLGEGTYGEVIMARHRRTSKKVAVKWVRGGGDGGHGPPDFRALTREAGCQAACRGHPSIVEILEVVGDAKTGDMFIVMELVAGGQSLREQIYRPLSEDVTRVKMRQLIDAAKKMHGAGIIHRDIKPENVLVGIFGGLKVCDFGAATRQKPAGVPYEDCRVGTMIYTSPEQLSGNRNYGSAVDMWALGCIMAELLGGETLFEAETEKDMLAEMSKLGEQIRTTGKLDLEWFAELSEAGREILMGLLAFCPEERLTAAEALEHRWFSKSSAFA
ncbi:putative cyclin-dependent kinase F-2 [Brachypodium distachyon]|uniref:[RNA-polymerase]-subunit kinase n=1 Tax=Brachypodium distachyon TaxID=15368 RepID=I1GUF7_BRADI|nr:putative cyclin-dependent kinase F-2 [Brachypodium distachyon]KQK16238.1 hypothetical protein BRADI_1g27750v3 [Brachypodium distachyon]|eukprot:XP_003560209.1 putative cyclin-dependent kinase F-2 [Brachypodium distachyon]